MALVAVVLTVVGIVGPMSATRGVAQGDWAPVASWQGQGIKETESFETTASEWRVAWATSKERVAGMIRIYVHRADGGGLVSLAANQMGTGQDVSYVRTPPGRYFLRINAANVDWSVAVEEQR
jgi:hypothetical protein